jgi:(p)ppGpp synthase/HD superfamily hydrolase
MDKRSRQKPTKIIKLAKKFAKKAHNSIDHKRKFSGEPYWRHCERVAYLVSLVTQDQNMVAAAWLHDVLEDVMPFNNQYSDEAIKNQFGEDVLDLVLDLTDVSRREDGNREKRKAIDREHSFAASPRAKLIKLADLIDNARDISDSDKGFAKIYLKEMALLLEGMQTQENTLLWQMAKHLCEMESQKHFGCARE